MGGVNAVKRASLDELKALTFLPDAVAEAVYAKFHAVSRSRRSGGGEGADDLGVDPLESLARRCSTSRRS